MVTQQETQARGALGALRQYQAANDRRVGAIEQSVGEIKAHVEPIAAMKPALEELVEQQRREEERRLARDVWLKRVGKLFAGAIAGINGVYVVGKMAGWWG